MEVFEKLVAADIQLLPAAEITTHFVLERDGFVCLVERRGDGFGKAGTPGLLVEAGLAQLVWRGDTAYFVAKSWQRAASAEEIEAFRNFSATLKNIFG
jgi:hypothetical protein